MGLEQLCAEIESRSHSQATAILKSAHEDAKRILDSAHADGQRALEAARAEADAFSSAEASSRLTATQLEASRHMMESREEAVRQCLEQVWGHYRQMPRRSGYSARLKAWAQKATDELGQAGSMLHANESDSETLRGAGFKVARKALDCAGGVRAETADGRIAVDYTLEAQFERKREELLHLIHLKLFTPEDSAVPDIPPAGERGQEKKSKSYGQDSQRAASGQAKTRQSGPSSQRGSPRVLDFSAFSMPVSSRSSLGGKKPRR